MLIDWGAGPDGKGARLLFTPADWRAVLEDAHFLDGPTNSYNPRRLRGVNVEIVPSYRIETLRQYASRS
jgi:hypothetical protein